MKVIVLLLGASSASSLGISLASMSRVIGSIRQATCVAFVEGLQAMLRAVFSHVWAESKQIAAVTPKGVYLPLLATLWK